MNLKKLVGKEGLRGWMRFPNYEFLVNLVYGFKNKKLNTFCKFLLGGI